MEKLSIRKYDGDDVYSWAIFYSKDIKGIRGPVMYGQAKPIMCGLGKSEALYHKGVLEK